MDHFRLPLFITPQNKLKVGAWMGFIAAVLYLGSHHVNLFETRQLPLWWIDRNTPFLPWTLWIYVSEYYLFLIVYLLVRNLENVAKYVYSFMAVQTISIVIFIVFPIAYPRENFPLPADLDPATRFVFENLRFMDSPRNCLPSLHVSSCYLSAFMFLNEQRRKFLFFFAWATLVAISTLTTKQHYLIDVITGFSLAVVAFLVFNRVIRYR
jgi:membrane-associated phospholipid phosphatase